MKEEEAAPNTRKLMKSIDAMAGKISKELDMISAEQKNPDGTEVELSSKFVDTFLKMVKDADKIKSFIDISEGMDGQQIETKVTETTTETVVTETKKPLIDIGDNPFEKVIKKVKQQKNGV